MHSNSLTEQINTILRTAIFNINCVCFLIRNLNLQYLMTFWAKNCHLKVKFHWNFREFSKFLNVCARNSNFWGIKILGDLISGVALYIYSAKFYIMQIYSCAKRNMICLTLLYEASPYLLGPFVPLKIILNIHTMYTFIYA